MSNLSKKKRQEIHEFLSSLKKDYSDDVAIQNINEIERLINEKKYGLVWEKHTENVNEMLKENIPIFKEVEDKKITNAQESKFNFLLEGDNLHSLKLLEKTHKELIDIIYIDPPYNRGKNDFKYDDNYIDENDGFKHSKWLSFMYNRLKIARKILSDDGIIFMSIDDNEQAQLKLLADMVFGENSFVIEMPRQTKKSGKTTGSFSKNHDYILVYTKKNNDIFKMQEHYDKNYKYEDEFVEKRGKYKLNQTLDYSSLSYSSSLDYPLEIEGETFYPGGNYDKYLERKKGNHNRADWAWRWKKDLFDFGYKNGFVVINRKDDGSARIYTKTYLKAKIKKDKKGKYHIAYVRKTKPMSSIELTENVYSNDRAKKDLAKFGLKDDFDYSKPVELIKTLIKCHKNKNAIVLDFFAGSGTTAEATLLANIEDGGNRKFILCTNNENDICKSVTYKRIKDTINTYELKKEDEELLYENRFNMSLLKKADKVLKEIDSIKNLNKNSYDRIKVSCKDNKVSVYGITKISIEKGIPANLKYFKTDFIPKFSEEEVISTKLIPRIKEMIELENMCEIDGKRNLLILNEEDLENKINEDIVENANIYIPSHILLSREEENIIEKKNINIIDIPDYYFMEELREVGEL